MNWIIEIKPIKETVKIYFYLTLIERKGNPPEIRYSLRKNDATPFSSKREVEKYLKLCDERIDHKTYKATIRGIKK
jgi:hypothetical protein